MIRWDQYSGYLSSPQTATVNARVSGLIEEAPFQEGAIVHAGELLFKIDPRPFQADLDNKKAAVAQAKATAAKTKADFERSTQLVRAQVIAQADYDTTKASYVEAAASLKCGRGGPRDFPAQSGMDRREGSDHRSRQSNECDRR